MIFRSLARFCLTFYGLISLLACTNGKLDISSLGNSVRSFSIEKGGSETSALKLNLSTDSADFSVRCGSKLDQLQASFDSGATWTKVADLSCSSGSSDVSLSFSGAREIPGWPSSTAQLIAVQLKAIGKEEKSRVLTIEFLRANFEASSLSLQIEGGKTITNQAKVSLTVAAKQTAGGKSFLPSSVYVSNSANCDEVGRWIPYATTLKEIDLLNLNSTNALSVKFADDAGNESACKTASIQHDDIPPLTPYLRINSGSARTNSSSITLNLSASENPVEVKILNSLDCSGTAPWEPLATSKNITLTNSGTNRFSVRYRDAAKNESSCVSASVIWDNNPPQTPTSLARASGFGAKDNKLKPQIVVSPVLDEDTVTLYTDPSCTTDIGVGVGTGNNEATVTSDSVQTNATTTFYAKVSNSNTGTSACSTASVNYTHDGIAPAIVELTSTATDGNYKKNDVVPIRIEFTENVIVAGGTPTLLLKTLAGSASATYVSGSGSNRLIFNFVIGANDQSADLDAFDGFALQLNGATIRDEANNNAVLAVPVSTTTGSLATNKNLKINYDVGISKIFAPSAGDFFKNESLDFIVRYENPVTVTGSSLCLVIAYAYGNSSTNNYCAFYVAARSTSTDLFFTWTLPTNLPADAQALTVQSLQKNTSTITTSFGAEANYTLPSVTDYQGLGVKVYSGDRPTIGFADTAAVIARESDGIVNLALSFTAPLARQTSVKYRIAAGTSASASDHTLTDGEVILAAGATSGKISFSIVNDSLAEPVESLSVQIYNVSPGVSNGNTFRHIYIEDDDSTAEGITSLAAGSQFSCAILTGGKLVCWGDNSYGQLGNGTTKPSDVPVTVFTSGVTNVAINKNTACAVSLSSLYCWGENINSHIVGAADGPVVAPTKNSSLTNVTAVAMNGTAVCAVYNSGKVACWGKGDHGQLGSNSTNDSASPVNVNSINNATSVTMGTNHACVFTADAKIKCWGANASGQVGSNSTTDQLTPVTVTISNTAAQVIAGANTTCALAKEFIFSTLLNTHIYCWGEANEGGLGNNNTVADKLQPPTTSILDGATSLVSRGSDGSQQCAVASDGTLKCWGRGYYTDNVTQYNTPTAPATYANATKIAIGDSSLCFTLSGRAEPFCGGMSNARSQISPTLRAVPTVFSTRKILSLSGSPTFGTCMVDENGAVECATSTAISSTQTSASIGDGGTAARPSAVRVFNSGFVRVSVGHDFACALRNDASLWCFGGSGTTYPGDNTSTKRTSPTMVAADVTDFSLGNGFACLIKSNKNLYCWGLNNFGQLGNPSLSSPTLVPSLVASNASSISTGRDHACAVIDSKLKCWGTGSQGQIGDGGSVQRTAPTEVIMVNVTSVNEVSVGLHTSCALFDAGSLRCWGANDYGQLGRGNATDLTLPIDNALTSATKVSTGYETTCAISSGNVYCFGLNSLGAIGNGTVDVKSNTTNYRPVLVTNISNATNLWTTKTGFCAQNASNASTLR